jgi:hypothetical protein
MKIALDIDDTITRHPDFFSVISGALIKEGHEVHIITFRDPQEPIAEELDHLGIKFTALHTNDDFGDDPDSVVRWKADVCERLGIDVFFEDMLDVARKVKKPTVVFVPLEEQS